MFKRFFFRTLYRYQLGSQAIQIVNFALLIVVTAKQFGVRAGPALLVVIPVGFFIVWLWGFIQDRYWRQQEHNEEIVISRSPMAKEHYQKSNEMYEDFKKSKNSETQ